MHGSNVVSGHFFPHDIAFLIDADNNIIGLFCGDPEDEDVQTLIRKYSPDGIVEGNLLFDGTGTFPRCAASAGRYDPRRNTVSLENVVPLLNPVQKQKFLNAKVVVFAAFRLCTTGPVLNFYGEGAAIGTFTPETQEKLMCATNEKKKASEPSKPPSSTNPNFRSNRVPPGVGGDDFARDSGGNLQSLGNQEAAAEESCEHLRENTDRDTPEDKGMMPGATPPAGVVPEIDQNAPVSHETARFNHR